jgi:hypothetical protein
MPTYVMRNGELVEKQFAGPRNGSEQATYVISDTMDETRHMGDGKHYTSKKAFRDATRALGCIEYGNELPTLLKPRVPVPLSREKRVEDIKRTIYELRNKR